MGTFPWMEPKPGSMGVPNPQYDIDLLTHDGRSAEDGEQGQIVIRTDRGKPLGLFKEYYRAAELPKMLGTMAFIIQVMWLGVMKTVTFGLWDVLMMLSRVPATVSARSKWKVH